MDRTHSLSTHRGEDNWTQPKHMRKGKWRKNIWPDNWMTGLAKNRKHKLTLTNIHLTLLNPDTFLKMGARGTQHNLFYFIHTINPDDDYHFKYYASSFKKVSKCILIILMSKLISAQPLLLIMSCRSAVSHCLWCERQSQKNEIVIYNVYTFILIM